MSTRATSAGERRRREILDAALLLFLEKGVEATTVEDVRRASGASVGSIYHLFDGKEAIAGALWLRILAEWHASFLAELERAASAPAAVRSAIAHYVEFVRLNPERARFLVLAPKSRLADAIRAEVREANRGFLKALRKNLARHVEAGHVRALPPDLFVAVFLGPAIEWSRQWLSGTAKSDPATAKRTLADAAWRALRTDAGNEE